jgi:hypothetical protein
MKMSGADHDALWSAVERGEGDGYKRLIRELKVVPSVVSVGVDVGGWEA